MGDQGNDTLDGDGDGDQVAYFLETGTMGVNVDLRAGTATDTWGHSDTLIGIEYVHGSDGNDTLLGTDNHGDRFFGRGGNDYMDGRDGNDLYYTGDGDDTIVVGGTIADARDTIVVNGSGTNTIIGGDSEGTQYGHHLVFEIDEAVTVNMATGIATSANSLTDFTQALYFLEVGGTMHDDLLIGGNPRHDYLEWYVGNQGNDTLNGGGGEADTVVYDDEVEIGSFNFTTGQHEYGTRGVVVNLSTGVATDTFGFTDTLIEIDDVRATRFADNIVGTDGANAFWGLRGNDTLDGGEGIDRAHYGEDYITDGTAGVTVNLFTGVAIDGFGTTDTLISIEEVYATNQNDLITGNNVDNRIFGYGGNDTLLGYGGVDVLVGGAGNDSLRGGDDHDELNGGEGSDTLDGGQGDDLVRYRDDTAGVHVDLLSQVATDGGGASDTLIGIEGAHGSDFNDTLSGDGGDNELSGFAGNDTLEGRTGRDTLLGGAGNDTLRGGAQDDELWGQAGNDSIDGGDGSDLVRYRDAAGGVVLNLTDGLAQDGDGGLDTLVSIEHAHGSDHGDRLTGDAGGNELSGFGGNDTIDGLGGNDTILGGAGNDSLRGGADNDEIWGEAGNDTIDGLGGFDIVRYLGATAGVVVDLAAGQAQDGEGGTDSLIGIEGAHGSDHNDTLRGDSAANELSGFGGDDTLQGALGDDTLLGGAGNDSLQGGAGNDELWGGDGFDTLDGGDGTDLVRYRDDTAGVTVNLANSAATDGAGNADVLIGIEDVDGSDHGDRLTGDGAGNRIFGFGGNDTLTGAAGDDTFRGGTGNDSILGGDGNDELWGEAGNDTLDGGSGIDLIRYRAATGGVTVDLTGGQAVDGYGGTDTLLGIENAHGSDHGDVLRGNGGANELRGFLGNDSLQGFVGNDTLLGDEGSDTLDGGSGDDLLIGGAGNDTLRGGAGHDIARYLDATGGVVVDLAAGQAQDGEGGLDSLSEIEGAHGSAHNDTLRGDAGANELSGFGGNDTLQGSLGNDTILGGDGNDLVQGGAGNDELWGGDGVDTLDGGDGTDLIRYRDDTAGVTVNLISGQAIDGSGALESLISIENAHGSDHADRLTGDVIANELSGFDGNDTLAGNGGNDTLLGGAGNDSLSGGANNDELWGEAGNDTIDGGDGVDMVRYRTAGSGVVVDLSAGQAQDGDGGTDTILNVEHAHGSDFADDLRGNGADNELSGFDGHDTLQGFDGNDTLLGGAGDDSILGGTGNDEIWGNGGDDTLDGGAGDNDLLRYRDDSAGVSVDLIAGTATDGEGGTDTILNIEDVHSSDHADSLRGSDAANRLFGFAGDDTILGEGGADVILGDGGDDSLSGGDGDDEIWGGAGTDTIDGGAGSDLVRYLDAIGPVTVDLAAGTAQDGFGATDTLISIEQVHGSDHGDSLTGDGEANRLFGYGGRDTIDGAAGNDVMLGGDGNDNLSGGDGNDEIWGEAGDDTIDGGAGTDLVRFRNATGGITVNLVLGTASGEGADLLSNVENIDGSDQADHITGDNQANVLSGFGGADTLIGGAGDDVLAGRAGGDRYEFAAGDGYDIVNDLGDGLGTDVVVFHDYFAHNASIYRQNPTNEAIVINFGATGDIVVLANTLNAGHTSAIEQIIWGDGTVWSHGDLIAALDQVGVPDAEGPTPLDNLLNRTPNDDVTDALAGNDLVRGLGGDDSLLGNDGNDTLEGGEGNDTLLGGGGDDVLEGGPGDDVKDGGEGNDTAVYSVRLDDATVTYVSGVFTIASHLGTDTVTNVETFRFADQTLTLVEMIAIGENAAPVSTLPATLTSTEGAVNLNLGQYFSDPEGATLGFSVLGLPDGLTVSDSGLVVTGTVEASLTPFILTITAEDALNGRVTDTVVWTVQNVNADPTGGVTIAGQPLEGQVLTAVTDTLADADGLGALSFVWTRDGTAITGAQTDSYRLTAADIGAQIGVQVSYVDGFGTTETVSAPLTTAVQNVNVAPTGGVSISGTATEGQTLTANTATLADGDGLGTLQYQWLRDGAEIDGATAVTYVLGNDDIGARITVRVSYTDAQGTDESVLSPTTSAVQNVNDAPGGAVAINGTAAEGETLSADTSTLSDGDGLGLLSYQWLRDGVAVSGATGATYLLGPDDIGASISVLVSYTDGHGTGEAVASAGTAAVINTNDAPTGAVVIQGTASHGATLTADTSTLSDADGVGSLSYQWLRDGVAISGATSATYVLATDDIGAQITVQVSYTDGSGFDESLTSAATDPIVSGNEAPTGAVLIQGTAAQSETLLADTSTLADANGLGEFSYQWLRDGSAISGATGATYTLTQEDVGSAISLRVSYTDGLGTNESLTSAATAAVTDSNDAPTGTIRPVGTPTQGETLSVDTSELADTDGLGPLSYQWLRGGVAISGATAATYTLTQEDVGRSIQVRVSYTDGLGIDESVTSVPTPSVENVNDPVQGVPVITGDLGFGSVLGVDVSGLSDPDGLGVMFYEWYRDGVFITGQRASTYTVVTADDGAALTVQVYYTDGQGTVERVSSAPTGPAGNSAPSGTLLVTGNPNPGEVLTIDASGISDPDGIGRLFYEWYRDDVRIAGAFADSYTVTPDDLGHQIAGRVIYTDGGGTVEGVTSTAVQIISSGVTRTGTPGNDRLEGGAGTDVLNGLDGNDTLVGFGNDDTLNGGDGSDVLNAGDGDDFVFGGATEADLRDVVYGGEGNDSIDGGYGNDELRGDGGNDTIVGGFGADTVIGGDGDDALTGQAYGDEIFGSGGNDFVNGGFGHDRVNGGTGADRFYHLGIFDHGSDWIQDYSAAEGDILQFGQSASLSDFQVNFTETANAGVAGVEEAFVIYRPTGQIIWALVDGGAQNSLTLMLGSQSFDLLA